MGFGGIIGWVVYSGFGYEVYISDGITFGLDDEYNIVSFYYSFCGFNGVKTIVL